MKTAIRRAVIDVGTNSVKLLLGDVRGNIVDPVLERSEQTRLGSGFYRTRRLQPQAIARTAQVVARFVAEAADHEARSVRILATSAARDALNREELLEAIRRSSGRRSEIISGEQEADWTFRGVRSDPIFAEGALLIFDIGGGSTEFILGEGRHPGFRHSFPLGTIRLLDEVAVSDPPSLPEWNACRNHLRAFFNSEIVPRLFGYLSTSVSSPARLVGTGGTLSIMGCMELGLSRFNREKLEGALLVRASVSQLRKTVWERSLEQRKQLVGLPHNRTDVILAGTAICEILMETLHFNELRVSTRGWRHGVLLA